MKRSLSLALLALPLAAFPASAQEAVIAAMPPAEEACYGLTHDAEHLAANPQQTIVELFLTRLHTPDPEREDGGGPDLSAAAAVRTESDPHYPSTALEIMALLREPRGRYGALVNCRPQEGGTVRCGAECDGGGFSLRATGSEASIRFEDYGVRVGAGCGAAASQNVGLGAREADREVRLTRLPVSACVAARTAARPEWVRHGRPLRETLRSRRTCFTRSYDAAHLARTPDQQVVSMTLRATWRPAAEHFDISLRARLRDGSSSTARAQCTASDYQFACESGGVDHAITLRRGPNGSVIVRSPAQEDPAGEPPLATALDLRLGRADDVFRLDPTRCAR